MGEWYTWQDHQLWKIYQPIINGWPTPEHVELEARFIPDDERPCPLCGRDQDDGNTCYGPSGVHMGGHKHPVFAHLEVTETDPEMDLEVTHTWELNWHEIISPAADVEEINPPEWLADLFRELRLRPPEEVCEDCQYPPGEKPSSWVCTDCGHPQEISYSYWPEVWENIREARRGMFQAVEEHTDA